MSIRFYCKRCHQLLGIASRKAGTEIQCPECGLSQVVPNEEAASATVAMDQSAKTRDAIESASSLVVYDDGPAAIEQPPSRQLGQSPPRMPGWPGADRPGRGAADEPGRSVPHGMVLYPRRNFYLQGVLLLILFAVGFGSGYLIGRGGAAPGQSDRAATQRLLIEGNVVYDPGSGRPAGDENAVIVALPKGKLPERKIAFQGIRPQASSAERRNSVRAIRQLGGEYARAEASGSYSMVVPDRGEYHLLIISNHAARPSEAEVDELDLVEMEQYFSMADPWSGRHKFRWISRQIDDDTRIDHDFGLDGQE